MNSPVFGVLIWETQIQVAVSPTSQVSALNTELLVILRSLSLLDQKCQETFPMNCLLKLTLSQEKLQFRQSGIFRQKNILWKDSQPALTKVFFISWKIKIYILQVSNTTIMGPESPQQYKLPQLSPSMHPSSQLEGPSLPVESQFTSLFLQGKLHLCPEIQHEACTSLKFY